jgi:hypothetical protein
MWTLVHTLSKLLGEENTHMHASPRSNHCEHALIHKHTQNSARVHDHACVHTCLALSRLCVHTRVGMIAPLCAYMFGMIAPMCAYTRGHDSTKCVHTRVGMTVPMCAYTRGHDRAYVCIHVWHDCAYVCIHA